MRHHPETNRAELLTIPERGCQDLGKTNGCGPVTIQADNPFAGVAERPSGLEVRPWLDSSTN